jgi:alcohol dehydrogenase class IV
LRLGEEISSREVGKTDADAIRRLNSEIGIPALRDLGVLESSVDTVAVDVLKDDCANFVPKEINKDLVAALLRNTR